MSSVKNARPSSASGGRPAKRSKKDVSAHTTGLEDSDATIPSDRASSPETKDTFEDGAVTRSGHVNPLPETAITLNGASTMTNRDRDVNDTLVVPHWVCEDVKSRLRDFVTFAEPATNRYAAAHVPSSAKWGDNTSGTDYAKYLCHNGKPVVIWLVGIVGSKWFYNRMGEPQDKVNIAITPIRDEDMRAIAALLSKSSPTKAFNSDKVYAGRMMADWVKGEERPRIGTFINIFDATKGFGHKSTLKRKHAHDIGTGDIVLVETSLTRYKTGSTKYTWEKWNTSFELRAISLLAEIPTGQATTEVDDFDFDGDTVL